MDWQVLIAALLGGYRILYTVLDLVLDAFFSPQEAIDETETEQ